jgi:hypothetical protein
VFDCVRAHVNVRSGVRRMCARGTEDALLHDNSDEVSRRHGVTLLDYVCGTIYEKRKRGRRADDDLAPNLAARTEKDVVQVRVRCTFSASA